MMTYMKAFVNHNDNYEGSVAINSNQMLTYLTY